MQFLVHTSTADVCFNARDQDRINEDAPYCRRPHSAQLTSLITAEQLVLEANCEQLNTCVLRPCMMYGPGDPLHWPDLLSLEGKNRSPLMLGQQRISQVDWVFVEHAAHAHCLAAEKLLVADPDVAGHVRLVTLFPRDGLVLVS